MRSDWLRVRARFSNQSNPKVIATCSLAFSRALGWLRSLLRVLIGWLIPCKSSLQVYFDGRTFSLMAAILSSWGERERGKRRGRGRRKYNIISIFFPPPSPTNFAWFKKKNTGGSVSLKRRAQRAITKGNLRYKYHLFRLTSARPKTRAHISAPLGILKRNPIARVNMDLLILGRGRDLTARFWWKYLENL